MTFAGGSGTYLDPYLIDSEAGLAAITSSGVYLIVANITVESSWTTISTFTGRISGLGHTISGLDAPFVGELKSIFETPAIITDINFENCIVNESYNTVGLVACEISSGTAYIEKISMYLCSVTGAGRVGGICGDNLSAERGSIRDCDVETCSVKAVDADVVGGIVGRGSAIDCVVTGGVITADATWNEETQTYSGGQRAGGVVGQLQVGINLTMMGGSVNGLRRLGGIAGEIAGPISPSDVYLRLTGHSVSTDIVAAHPWGYPGSAWLKPTDELWSDSWSTDSGWAGSVIGAMPRELIENEPPPDEMMVSGGVYGWMSAHDAAGVRQPLHVAGYTGDPVYTNNRGQLRTPRPDFYSRASTEWATLNRSYVKYTTSPNGTGLVQDWPDWVEEVVNGPYAVYPPGVGQGLGNTAQPNHGYKFVKWIDFLGADTTDNPFSQSLTRQQIWDLGVPYATESPYYIARVITATAMFEPIEPIQVTVWGSPAELNGKLEQGNKVIWAMPLLAGGVAKVGNRIIIAIPQINEGSAEGQYFPEE